MKNKGFKISLIFIIATLIFISLFKVALRNKEPFYFMSDEYYDYVEVEFIEVKEEEGFNEVYFKLKNKSDYYMMASNFRIRFNEDYNGINKLLELNAKEEKFYKHQDYYGNFYLSPGEEKVYFVEAPKDLKLNTDYEGKSYASYMVEVRLYLIGINGNTLLTEMLMMSTSSRIEIYRNLFNN